MERLLAWDGCFNVRDLGGLRTADGRRVRRGALVRGDGLDRLTPSGWEALMRHGVRTVIDLRNDEERRGDAAPRPASVRTIDLPLDAREDRSFWAQWEGEPGFGTPLYYAPHLARFPHRSAAVVAAIADAGPGGVAFHCVAGRDRSGMIAMTLLALLGVSAQDIAVDYALSRECLQPWFADRGEADQGPVLEAFLVDRGTSATEVIVATLAALDVERCLLDAGLKERDLEAVRARALAA